MLTTRMFHGADEPLPEEVDVPVKLDPSVTAEYARANEATRRQRLMVVGGLSLLGVVVAGAMALVYFTREPRSAREHHPLRAGQNRCIGNVKYRVVNDYGKLRRIGVC